MTIRNWLRLFWSTVMVGTAAAIAAGGVLILLFDDFSLMELSRPGLNWQTVLFIILAGSTISVISHVGFFSYLFVRDIFLGFLRSRLLWNILQIILVGVAFEMMTYIRWSVFHKGNEGWASYLIMPLVLLGAAAVIALIKSVMTNRSAFIPTLFFLFVATILEALPALRIDSLSSNVFMLIPLIASNAWQILFLPRYLKNKKEPAIAA